MKIVSDWTPVPLLMKALVADPTLSDEDRAWWADALTRAPDAEPIEAGLFASARSA